MLDKEGAKTHAAITTLNNAMELSKLQIQECNAALDQHAIRCRETYLEWSAKLDKCMDHQSSCDQARKTANELAEKVL